MHIFEYTYNVISFTWAIHGAYITPPRLGAGIGRFSGVLARKARKVTAVDFVATSCVENRKANAEKNLEVIQAMAAMGFSMVSGAELDYSVFPFFGICLKIEKTI